MGFVPFFLIWFAVAFAQLPYFQPPAGWEIAQSKQRSPYIYIGFFGPSSSQFRPSLNLATEEIDVSLKEYVQAVLEIHRSDRNVQCRNLGTFAMQGGEGKLLEITHRNGWGVSKLLQAILVKEKTAYILTASASNDDFAHLKESILQSMRSFQIIDDLSSPIRDERLRQNLKSFFDRLGYGEDPQKQWELWKGVIHRIKEMGPYWQFLALQEGYARIYSMDPSPK